MSESESRKRRRSKPVKEQLFPISKFGKVIIALAPVKPALWLSERIGSTERAANFYITGERKPSARAAAIVLNEMLE